MKTKTKETIVSELREHFNIGKEGILSFETNGKFGIHKQEFERFDVIAVLENYFKNVVVQEGYVEVDPITFVFTTFKVKNFSDDDKEKSSN